MRKKINKQNIAIFASGGGSNAREILKHFQNHQRIHVAVIVTNKSDAGVVQVAADFGIPVVIITKSALNSEQGTTIILKKYRVSYIILAGFLLLIPAYLIQLFPKRIINIHPALLPKFGGKGMYGHFVHEAVKKAGVLETGITIHFCNAEYDEGDIIFQAKCPVVASDSPEDIAGKVLKLEHENYPAVIERIIT